MKRNPITRGVFLLMLGLIVFQFGLLATFGRLSAWIGLNVLPDTLLVELMGVLLQLLGGFLIVAGLTSLISSIIAIQLESELRTLRNEILSGVDERISDITNMIARQKPNTGPQTHQTARVCKFCGTQLGDEDFFCPSCGKAQN
ncbi:MAG TPA: zinc ribbon domain-containing protein [Candidatus Bathyarchaeia archaeon]|nr:zinc ribbon domain-containing protein [Candidatus Bathyarchaeia archaeon]